MKLKVGEEGEMDRERIEKGREKSEEGYRLGE
jgi:hypothetical protein